MLMHGYINDRSTEPGCKECLHTINAPIRDQLL